MNPADPSPVHQEEALPVHLVSLAATAAFLDGETLPAFNRLVERITRLKKEAVWHAIERALEQTGCPSLRIQTGSIIDGDYTLEVYIAKDGSGTTDTRVVRHDYRAHADPTGAFAFLHQTLDAVKGRDLHDFFTRLRHVRFTPQARQENAVLLFGEHFLAHSTAAQIAADLPAPASVPLQRARL